MSRVCNSLKGGRGEKGVNYWSENSLNYPVITLNQHDICRLNQHDICKLDLPFLPKKACAFEITQDNYFYDKILIIRGRGNYYDLVFCRVTCAKTVVGKLTEIFNDPSFAGTIYH